LAQQVFPAVGALVFRRKPVSRRAAFEDVANVDFFTLEARRGNDLIEQLAGFADEGLALLVFVGARRFADEQNAGLGIADAEDRLRACRGQLAATGATLDFVSQNGQSRLTVRKSPRQTEHVSPVVRWWLIRQVNLSGRHLA
jgi:hypothetical protein